MTKIKRPFASRCAVYFFLRGLLRRGLLRRGLLRRLRDAAGDCGSDVALASGLLRFCFLHDALGARFWTFAPAPSASTCVPIVFSTHISVSKSHINFFCARSMVCLAAGDFDTERFCLFFLTDPFCQHSSSGRSFLLSKTEPLVMGRCRR